MTKIRVAINGFGRIGRCVARAIFENNNDYKDIDLVAINGSKDYEIVKHLLKYDSVHGKFSKEVSISNDKLIVNDKEILLISERDPANLPWKELGIDVILECTGAFTEYEKAMLHVNAGAKRVLISAPAKADNVKTIVFGVNDNQYKAEDKVISVGSCTTNCLAPIAKILNDNIGIVKGLMTTVHAYTNDQNIVDNNHKDFRRARACAMSMIPTSTGAAKALGLVLPELKGKLDGVAIRVPTPNVSMVDLNFIATRKTSISEINEIVKSNINSDSLKKVISYVTEPLVSIDFNHSSHSSYFDSTQTKVIGEDFVKVASWYDNEWAFSLRMLDLANLTRNFI